MKQKTAFRSKTLKKERSNNGSVTSTFADLSEAPPEDSDKGNPVVRSGSDVVKLPEEDVVAVLHAAETAITHNKTTGESLHIQIPNDFSLQIL